jgi:hypothetical protein
MVMMVVRTGCSDDDFNRFDFDDRDDDDDDDEDDDEDDEDEDDEDDDDADMRVQGDDQLTVDPLQMPLRFRPGASENRESLEN